MSWTKAIKLLGVLLAVFALVLAVAALTYRVPEFFRGAICAFTTAFAIAWAQRHLKVRRAGKAFFSWHGSRGKDVLLVHSNSPHWQSYIASQRLPRLGTRAVLLNWSERHQWDREPPEVVAAFRRYAGTRNFNPMAIVFEDSGKVQVIRFWSAFRDHRHGRSGPLRDAESRLFTRLDRHCGSNFRRSAYIRFAERWPLATTASPSVQGRVRCCLRPRVPSPLTRCRHSSGS